MEHDSVQRYGGAVLARLTKYNVSESDAICESKCGRSPPGSQIAFQINTALVNTIKQHHAALVNVTEYVQRRV